MRANCKNALAIGLVEAGTKLLMASN